MTRDKPVGKKALLEEIARCRNTISAQQAHVLDVEKLYRDSVSELNRIKGDHYRVNELQETLALRVEDVRVRDLEIASLKQEIKMFLLFVAKLLAEGERD